VRYKRTKGKERWERKPRPVAECLDMAPPQGGFKPDRGTEAVTPTAARRWDTGTDIIRTSSSNS